jgi:hypothetical protein
MRLPAPPQIRMMAALAACERNTTRRPSADQIIDAHITIERHHGRDFAPWTAEGGTAFRNRRQVAS